MHHLIPAYPTFCYLTYIGGTHMRNLDKWECDIGWVGIGKIKKLDEWEWTVYSFDKLLFKWIDNEYTPNCVSTYDVIYGKYNNQNCPQIAFKSSEDVHGIISDWRVVYYAFTCLYVW